MSRMSSGSWVSYQAALPPEARAGSEPDYDDDPPTVPRWAIGGPSAIVVEWFVEFEYDDVMTEYDPATETYRDVPFRNAYQAPVERWFPAERWAWKHAVAWRDAMSRKFGHATIEEVF